jgi:hypothetical protein
MIFKKRLLAAILTLLFGGLNVSFSMFELDHYNDSTVIIALGLIYFLTLVLSVAQFEKELLPIWRSWLAFAIASTIPIISHVQLTSPEIRDKDTWYVTGIAILLSVLAVRRRIYFVIVGGLIYISETLYFCGIGYFSQSGITGAVLLIGSTIAISRGLETFNRQIQNAQAILKAKEERVEFRRGVIEEYEHAIGRIKANVMPKLKRVASGKYFSKADRELYQYLEWELRDVISGNRLINAQMKKAVQKARERGVDVALLDEGGLKFVERGQLDNLIDILAATLSEINTGRVTIRTQPKEPWLIRMTASRPRVVTPDLDLKLGER